jgi:hypothetical protein
MKLLMMRRRTSRRKPIEEKQLFFHGENQVEERITARGAVFAMKIAEHRSIFRLEEEEEIDVEDLLNCAMTRCGSCLAEKTWNSHASAINQFLAFKSQVGARCPSFLAMTEGQRVLTFLEYKKRKSIKGKEMELSSLMKLAEKFKLLFRDTGPEELDMDYLLLKEYHSALCRGGGLVPQNQAPPLTEEDFQTIQAAPIPTLHKVQILLMACAFARAVDFYIVTKRMCEVILPSTESLIPFPVLQVNYLLAPKSGYYSETSLIPLVNREVREFLIERLNSIDLDDRVFELDSAGINRHLKELSIQTTSHGIKRFAAMLVGSTFLPDGTVRFTEEQLQRFLHHRSSQHVKTYTGAKLSKIRSEVLSAAQMVAASLMELEEESVLRGY